MRVIFCYTWKDKYGSTGSGAIDFVTAKLDVDAINAMTDSAKQVNPNYADVCVINIIRLDD